MTGHNLTAKPSEIDVHGLEPREALRRVEKTLHELLLQPHNPTQLRVIVGRGNHSVGGVPVLKGVVLGEMQRCVFSFLFIPQGGDWHVGKG